MKTNIIYTCKYKLIGIDNIIPLLLELHARYAFLNFIIVFPDRFHYIEIKRNYLIWKALQSINAKSVVMQRDNVMTSGISLAKLALRMVFRKNVVIKNSEVLPRHESFMALIKKLSCTDEVFAMISNQTLEAYHLFELGYSLRPGKKTERKRLNEFYYDYYISSLDQANLLSIYRTKIESEKFMKIGYHRRLPSWTAFMENEIPALDRFGDPYFVFYLTGISGNRLGLDEPDYSVLLIEALEVLKKYNGNIKTVFKPHIITAMDEFHEILGRVGYDNYVIDYGHPMVLAQKAKFVFAYTYSSVLFDAYYMGKPVALYTQYDPRLYELLGRQSEGGTACDFFVHRDPQQMESVLDLLIRTEVTVERSPEFIRNNFPVTGEAFWSKWNHLLGSSSS